MNPLLIRNTLSLLFISLSFLISPARAVDLLDVYELAQGRDPQYRQVAAAQRAVLEQRPQALSQLLPAVAFSANTFSNDQDITAAMLGRSGEVSFNSHSYSLNVSQPLFRGERIVQYLQSGSRIKQADAELLAAEQDLIIRTTETYFDVLAAYDNLSFAQAEKKSLSRQLEQARQRFDVGLTAITDVQEAQAGYDRAFAEEIEAKNNIDNAQEALREITGEYMTDLSMLGEMMPLLSPQPADIDVWTHTALAQNLSILASQHAVDTARKEIKRQLAGHLPTVDVIARHSFNKTGGRFGAFESTDTAFGLELNVPIFQGGRVSSRVRESHERLNEQLERLEQAQRSAQRLTRQAYLGVLSGISRVKALKQALISSETALQATEAGFEVGTRTAVDVVGAERVTSQARRDYARARYDYLLNTLRLKQSSGALSKADLSHVNGWLN